MGERGARNEPAAAADIDAMAAIVREGIAAGALGFSTSRTLAHRAIDGEPVPGTFAAEDELFGIGRVLGELGTGWLALERLFGSAALPVLVPPWNRIAPGLVPALPEIGFRGLSTFGIRPHRRPVSGWVQANTHIDLIDWRMRRFAGVEAVLGAFARALSAARGSDEPVGLLSHHLAMDEPAWDFLNSFWERVGGTPGIGIAAANSLFASREARA